MVFLRFFSFPLFIFFPPFPFPLLGFPSPFLVFLQTQQIKPLAKTVNTIVVSSASVERVVDSPKRRQTGRLGTARRSSAMGAGKERRTLAAMQLQRTRSAVSPFTAPFSSPLFEPTGATNRDEALRSAKRSVRKCRGTLELTQSRILLFIGLIFDWNPDNFPYFGTIQKLDRIRKDACVEIR